MSPLGANWGVDPDEMSIAYPCDRLSGPFDDDLYRGVTVRTPAATLFRWLCQLRVAPYSYDWIDNWGRTSPRRLTPGLERLEVGQTMMTIFDLVDFEEGRGITCRIKPRTPAQSAFGDVVVSYRIVPRGDAECRLLAKLRIRYPRGLWGRLARLALPPGDWIMMRRQLLNLKALAEGTGRG